MSGGAKQQSAELFNLFWSLCDEPLSQGQAERLNELLRADPGSRRALIEFMDMVAGLEWEHSGIGNALVPATNPEVISQLSCEATPRQPSAATGRDLSTLIRPFLP